MKTGIVSQSNFVPWRGYFAALRVSDLLVTYDSQQFTRRDWRNRNLIASHSGQEWLTLAVKSSGNYFSPVNKMEIVDRAEVTKMIQRFRNRYSSYQNKEGFKFLVDIMSQCEQYVNLSRINSKITGDIAEYLNIKVRIESDEYLTLNGNKNEKLIQVCKEFQIDNYLTGPSARNYIDQREFSENGISVKFLDYSLLPPTNLTWEPSIIHWIATREHDEVMKLTEFI
jgi:hypothetical protein